MLDIGKTNLKQLLQDSDCSIQLIFEFFCKYRQKISDRFGGILFGKDHSTVFKIFGKILNNLSEVFVSKWLEASAFNREEIIQHNTSELFQQVFPNVRGGIDGTYFYVEKSEDFNNQRKTFNSHKKRNLIKEMDIILPNSKIFDFVGPFFSDENHNDEWMWIYIVDNNCGDITDVFDVNIDEFLADRGFLRVKQTDDTFTLQTPVGLAPKTKQLKTEDANQSRLVTRFRNIVERAFGRLKARWKIIGDIISSGLWPKLHKLVRLLAAIENAYFPPIWTDSELDKSDAEMINLKISMETNELQAVHESTEKKSWQKIDYNSLKGEVPALSLEDVRKWSVGPYALTLAKPYLKHCTDLKYWKHKKLENVYRVKGMVSRFVTSDKKSAKKYCVTVKIPKDGNIKQLITYCTCKSGARTLGGCAHSCTILYHLTAKDDNSQLEPVNSSKKRVLASGAIDLKSFKTQKMEKLKMTEENLQEDDDDTE